MSRGFVNSSLLKESSIQSNDSHIVYFSVMVAILTVGFIGNTLTIIVFAQKEHRSKIISPFIINLAVADLFIVVFGYPFAFGSNISNEKLLAGSRRCDWSAFVNGSIGIASIAILTEMSLIMWYSITTMVVIKKKHFPTKFKVLLIGIAWVYGVLSMIPPLLGWSRFVPGSAGISCAPDWTSTSNETLSYNILLMLVGFTLPVTVTATSYIKLYRSLMSNNLLDRQFQNMPWLICRRKSQVNVARMVALSFIAFLLSWSPYCFVCLAAMFQNTYAIKDGEAEIPELMAKASVLYNPFIYVGMNKDARKTLSNLALRILHQARSRSTLSIVSRRSKLSYVTWNYPEVISINNNQATST
uniref:Opsin n=1 Tax=Exaiptasia diaphana TaxID=2652724 RepID=A0A346FU00_EXADI|nr:opsin [Exaiptasia diaphana]